MQDEYLVIDMNQLLRERLRVKCTLHNPPHHSSPVHRILPNCAGNPVTDTHLIRYQLRSWMNPRPGSDESNLLIVHIETHSFAFPTSDMYV